MKKVICIFSLIFAFSKLSLSQSNLPNFELKRKIHFGFVIGLNNSNLRYKFSDKFHQNDSLAGIGISRYTGLVLGGIADLHMGKHLDLRTIPSLILAEHSIIYQFNTLGAVKKDIEAVFFEFPILLKYKTPRHNNVRFYTIAGLKYGIDLASEQDAKNTPENPIVAIKKHNFYYEFGFGFDMYFEFFKFSPEIKLSRGIVNILDDDNHAYTNIYEKISQNFIFITLNFEG